MALTNQSNRLAGLARREEALTAVEEAAVIYRDLAAARPDVFGHRLAASLDSLAALLSALGRDSEAEQARAEAAAIAPDE